MYINLILIDGLLSLGNVKMNGMWYLTLNVKVAQAFVFDSLNSQNYARALMIEIHWPDTKK